VVFWIYSGILHKLYQLTAQLGQSGIFGSPPVRESGRPKAFQERHSKLEVATGETSVPSRVERKERGERRVKRKRRGRKKKKRARERRTKMVKGSEGTGATPTPSKKKVAQARKAERERIAREAEAKAAHQKKVNAKAQLKAARKKEEEEKNKEVEDEDVGDIAPLPDEEGDAKGDDEKPESHSEGGNDSDLSELEIDLDDINTEEMVLKHNAFEVGKKAYLAWSTTEGDKSSLRGAKRIQTFFDKNKGEETFRDGFLVGAMYFHQSSPAVGDAQTALSKIGLESMITPITRTPTEPKNYEVRVWDKNNIESAYRIITKRGKEVAVIADKPFRWKDLRWIDKVVVKVTGLPFQWDEAWVRKGLFRNLGFPTAGLYRIVRVLYNGKTSGEVHLIYEYVPERIISWGRLARNDFKCTKTKVCAWRIAYPPREYDVYAMCNYCSWNHTTRVDCQVKLLVEKGGWDAAKEVDHVGIDSEKIPYITESYDAMEFAPMRRAQGDWARRRNEV
jgi:hypothetical protein